MSQGFFHIFRDSNQTPFYIIPTGTTLYRGESSINKETYLLPTDTTYPVFFGFDKENIEKNYGITYQFTTKDDIRCIAIDLLDNGSPFFKEAPSEIQDILLSNYGLVSKERVSESNKDKVLANYVCKLGIDGYATNVMDTRFDTFHAEIAICKPADKLHLLGSRVTSLEKAERLKQEQVLIEDGKNLRRKKRRPLFADSDSPPSSPRFIPPISFFTPPSSPIRGGRSTKKKLVRPRPLLRIRKKSRKSSNKKRT